MTQAYYERSGEVNPLNGALIYATDGDLQNEEEVRLVLEEHWGVTLRHFSRFDPVDYFVDRGGNTVAILEVKSPNNRRDDWPNAWLNVRKYTALQAWSNGMGVPALFVCNWTDFIGWVVVDQIDGSRKKMGGMNRRVKSNTDIEEMIWVPKEQFRGWPRSGRST